MAWRMPVLGQDAMGEPADQPVDDRHDGVTVGDSKRAAGTEIVLHIDNDKAVAFLWLDHRGLQYGLAAAFAGH